MKAKLEQIALDTRQRSFTYYLLNVPSFEFLWHYHPEYELTYIISGRGRRLVGDSYENFESGDLILLGPLLPHTWASGPAGQERSLAVVIQFSAAFIEPLLNYTELSPIKKMMQDTDRGLKFNFADDPGLAPLIEQLPGLVGAQALTSLITILQRLTALQSNLLSSEYFKPFKGNENQQRINKVFTYVQQQFTGRLSLQQAASMVYLSESAFCKFFKRISGKTFSDYVNEIRVSKACELLIETDKPIEQIAFETGFESQTYFNRIFLKKKGIRPKAFRSK